jgi:GT2 family glycosyltransferase
LTGTSEPKVVAVILTYERDELLRKAVTAVLGQSRPPDELLVVDNGTQAAPVLAPEVEAGTLTVLPTGSNLGPAGGYAFAFEQALARGADKVWVVDDDLEPNSDCLARLLAHADGVDVVFPLQYKPSGEEGFPPSWNGPLIDAAAIREYGLPRADLFFWAEDSEFFGRLAGNGVPLRKARDAIVMHWNPERRIRGAARDWRLYYEVRNLLWLRVRHRTFSPRQWWRAFRAVTGKLVRIVLYEPSKGRSLRLWWWGVQDFALGRMGRRVDPADWQRGTRS